MDHAWEDQISKYTKAVDDADGLGKFTPPLVLALALLDTNRYITAHQIEDARQVYHDHVADMRKLCRHVILASEKVRLESESRQSETHRFCIGHVVRAHDFPRTASLPSHEELQESRLGWSAYDQSSLRR